MLFEHYQRITWDGRSERFSVRPRSIGSVDDGSVGFPYLGFYDSSLLVPTKIAFTKSTVT